LAPDCADAADIRDYVLAHADFARIAAAVWTPVTIRANLAVGSVVYFELTGAVWEAQPRLCNRFFEAQGHELTVAALTRASQQKSEPGNYVVLLETFTGFVRLYNEYGKKRESLAEFVLSADSRIKSVFYKAVAPSARPQVTLRVFELAESVMRLSPACTQQVFAYLDKRFLGTVPEGTADAAVTFIGTIVTKLHSARKDAQAFAKLQCQWASCGPTTPIEVFSALASLLLILEVGDGCWQDVPLLLKKSNLRKPIPDKLGAVIQKLQERTEVRDFDAFTDLL
jgi:hypothetical protein